MSSGEAAGTLPRASFFQRLSPAGTCEKTSHRCALRVISLGLVRNACQITCRLRSWRCRSTWQEAQARHTLKTTHITHNSERHACTTSFSDWHSSSLDTRLALAQHATTAVVLEEVKNSRLDLLTRSGSTRWPPSSHPGPAVLRATSRASSRSTPDYGVPVLSTAEPPRKSLPP